MLRVNSQAHGVERRAQFVEKLMVQASSQLLPWYCRSGHLILDIFLHKRGQEQEGQQLPTQNPVKNTVIL